MPPSATPVILAARPVSGLAGGDWPRAGAFPCLMHSGMLPTSTPRHTPAGLPRVGNPCVPSLHPRFPLEEGLRSQGIGRREGLQWRGGPLTVAGAVPVLHRLPVQPWETQWFPQGHRLAVPTVETPGSLGQEPWPQTIEGMRPRLQVKISWVKKR